MSVLAAEYLRGLYRDLGVEITTALEARGEAVRIAVPGSQSRILLDRLHAADGGPRVRLVDLTVVDRRDEDLPTVEVVYCLETDEPVGSIRVHAQLLVSAPADPTGPAAPGASPDPWIDSVVGLWPSAGWLEREAAELFGVRFRGAGSPAPLLLGAASDAPPLRRGGSVARAAPSLAAVPGGGTG